MAYKIWIKATGLLPEALRARTDSLTSLVLIRANTSDEDLEAAYREALRLLHPESTAGHPGDYLEFGVSIGSSLALMHRVVQDAGLDRMHLYGFDSFEGLPESAKSDDEGYWAPRMFRSDIRMTRKYLTRAGVDWSRVTLIEGWYSETLTPALIAEYALRKAGVIMIDCDMYLSTRAALAFCAPLIRDRAVVLFDDWYAGGLDEKNLGEKRAFEEFMAEATQFGAEPIGRYRPNGKFFLVSRRSAPAA